jgi:hypothetical protein
MLRYVRAAESVLLLCMLLVGTACHWSGTQQPNAPSSGAWAGVKPAVGPVPDFAPLDEVRWHASLTTLAPDLPPLLKRLLGAAAIEEDDGPYEDGSLVWMRDYHPMLVRQSNGETKTVAYLAENQARSRLLNRRRTGKAARSPADHYLPLIHENGNLVTNGKLVLVSDRIFTDNAVDRSDWALRASGYRPRSASDVVTLLAGAVGRPRRDIVVLPSLPLEETQHVDVWLMFLDENTLIVPQVHPEGVARLPPDEQPGAEEVATFLDVQARNLARRDLRIVRLPMLPPVIVVATDASEDPADSEALFLTPANGLLITHDGKRVVILPDFDMQVIAPDMADLQAAYALIWEAELATHDWTVEFVDGTVLVQQLGLVRCVTAPIPQIGR